MYLLTDVGLAMVCTCLHDATELIPFSQVMCVCYKYGGSKGILRVLRLTPLLQIILHLVSIPKVCKKYQIERFNYLTLKTQNDHMDTFCCCPHLIFL